MMMISGTCKVELTVEKSVETIAKAVGLYGRGWLQLVQSASNGNENRQIRSTSFEILSRGAAFFVATVPLLLQTFTIVMHRALAVDDIVYHILNLLDPQCVHGCPIPEEMFRLDSALSSRHILNESRLLRQSLSHCARACRSFSTRALDILWSTQASLDDLIAVVNADMTNGMSGMNQFSAGITLTSCLVMTQWAAKITRLHEYARRITRITIRTEMWSRAGIALLSAFQAHFPQSVLLPRLSEIWWFVTGPYVAAPPLVHLCHPAKTMRFFVEGKFPLPPLEVQQRNAFFEGLGAILPNLERFTIQIVSTFPPGGFHQPFLSQILSSWTQIIPLMPMLEWCPRLRCFQSHHLPDLMLGLPLLSKMHCLTELHVAFTDRYPELEQAYNGSHSLKTLYIADRCSYTPTFIDRLCTTSLQHLHLRLGPFVDLRQWKKCVAHWSKLWSASLRIVEIEHGLESDDDGRHAASFREVYGQLWCIPGLQKFELGIWPNFAGGDWDFTEKDVWEMAKAWPNATSIVVDGLTNLHMASDVLLHCARHCPNLTKLHLPVADLRLPVDMGDRLNSTTPCALRELRFVGGNNRITDPVALGTFLDTVFPNLDVQRELWFYRALNPPATGWEEVYSVISQRRDARSEEVK
ncbi:hypothetical protein CERSUDRAFT_74783 [Gelatoporia subvermispora B]|uniref:Uncharacterized protein n=1 Tax=Ceriporiopsis subvermispora (strain B) TaxID=914234 RepID=M2RC89_CERS8|nr:hypothetical protein CERSUDRAFT_74783 [Gelatoporia subvermispora B]